MASDQPPVVIALVTDDVRGFCPSYQIVTASLSDVVRETQFEILGVGANENRDIAQKIALAEVAERYAVTSVPHERLSYGTLRQHRDRVDPRTLQQLSAKRAHSFQLSCFAESHNYYWIDGKELLRNQTVQLIADVCCAYRPPHYSQRFAWATSSGMAAHLEKSQAEQAALLELFERDALMVTWMARCQRPYVSRQRLPERAKESVQNAERVGYTCLSLDLTCRSIPVALAVMRHPGWPALVVGTAARFSLQEALIAAWKEAEVELFWALREWELENDESQLGLRDVILPADHARFYSYPANTHFASFLWGSSQETQRELEESVEGATMDIMALAVRHGLDTLYEVEYGSVFGLQIVRLLSPNLVPLLFGSNQFPVSHPGRGTCSGSDAGSRWPGNFIPPHPLA